MIAILYVVYTRIEDVFMTSEATVIDVNFKMFRSIIREAFIKTFNSRLLYRVLQYCLSAARLG